MPSFSLPDLLRKSPKDSRKHTAGSQLVETNGWTAAGRDSSPGRDGNTHSDDAAERKGRRGSRRDLLQDLRNRFGKAPSTPQRGTSESPASRDVVAVSGFLTDCSCTLFFLPTAFWCRRSEHRRFEAISFKVWGLSPLPSPGNINIGNCLATVVSIVYTRPSSLTSMGTQPCSQDNSAHAMRDWNLAVAAFVRHDLQLGFRCPVELPLLHHKLRMGLRGTWRIRHPSLIVPFIQQAHNSTQFGRGGRA